MQPAIVRGIGRLMAQEVAIRPGLAHGAVGLGRELSQRERHGAVGVVPLDAADEAADRLERKAALAALQNKGAEAERVPLGAAAEDLLGRQAIAGHGGVRAADAAVIAVVFAAVADLDQTADKNTVSVNFLPRVVGQRGGVLRQLGRETRDERGIFRLGEALPCCKPVNQPPHG